MATVFNKLSSTVKIIMLLGVILCFFLVTSASAVIFLSHVQWVTLEKRELNDEMAILLEINRSELIEKISLAQEAGYDERSYYFKDDNGTYTSGLFNVADISVFDRNEIIEFNDAYYLGRIAESPLGVIAYADNVTSYKEFEEVQISAAIIVVSIALIISLIVLYGVVKIIQRPIHNLIKITDRITLKNLDQQVLIEGNDKDPIVKLSRTLDQLLGRLRDSAEKLTQFNHDVSHELRTPLAVITTDLELAIETRDFLKLQETKEEIASLIELIEKLLFIASENRIFETSLVDTETMQSMLQKMKKNCEQLYAARGITYNIHDIEKFESCETNSKLLNTLLLNILENAGKHALPDSKVIVIVDTHMVKVQNTANPLTQEQLSNITQPFYKTDSSRAEKGYGIGLSVVRKIAELLHFTVNFSSEKGIFTVTIQCDS